MTQIVSIADVTSDQVAPSLQGGVASIGNFDGVHLGHASLLAQNRALADELGGPSIACLFDPHPIAILRPELAPMRLTSVAERARRMGRMGIDYLVVCRTSPELLNLSAENFFDALIVNVLKCRGLVEGENFCFGKNRRGNVDLLRSRCEETGIRFRVAEMQTNASRTISSTRIRELLNAGDVAGAGEIMAAPHSLTGVVCHGDGRGRTIGFPTANLSEVDVLIPAAGVYAGLATVDGVDHQAAIHIGESPTFQSGTAQKVEVHLPNFSADLYDKSLTIRFIHRVRGVQRFDSAESLIEQLQQDIQTVQRLLPAPSSRDSS